MLAIRDALRARRDALDDATRLDASGQVVAALTPMLDGVARLGAYSPVRGEVDCRALVTEAWRRGVDVYLPRAVGNSLVFAAHRPDLPLVRGEFGIPVPGLDAPTIAADALDLVLVPLVAFDATGTRLGTGFGYYDRTFAFRLSADGPGSPIPGARSAGHVPGSVGRPLLVGLAYSWQRVEGLDRQPWDVPLDLVVTDDGRVTRPGTP
jgi:5-formyltetrahydrofolate cyclo-ligase